MIRGGRTRFVRAAVVMLASAVTAGVAVPVGVAAAAHGSTARGDRPAYVAEARRALAEIVRATTVPSAIVVVRSRRYGDATFRFGTTVLDGDRRVSVHDHARVGSVTKTMTATVILQLVEEGRLALDDPVSRYVPGVPGGDAISIAQLLDMRSGLFSCTDAPGFFHDEVAADPQQVWTSQDLLDLAFAHPPDFAPGTNWHYSNTNYILLGLVMEQITGRPVERLFEQRLSRPLGDRCRSRYGATTRHSSLPPPSP